MKPHLEAILDKLVTDIEGEELTGEIITHLSRRCVDEYIDAKRTKNETPTFDETTRAFYYYLLQYCDNVSSNYKTEMIKCNNEFNEKFELPILPAFRSIVDEKTTEEGFKNEFRGMSRLSTDSADDLTKKLFEANKLLEYVKLRAKKLDLVYKHYCNSRYNIYKELIDVFRELKAESAAKLQRESSCSTQEIF
jgi:hypothetical protein